MLFVIIRLTHAMCKEIDHVKARYVLRLEEVDRLAFLFRKDCDQYICAGHFGFA